MKPSRLDVLGLAAATAFGAFCGWNAIPFGIEALATRTARIRARATQPTEVDCRPVQIRLTASSDVLQTVYTMNAFLENWRGDLIIAVRGWDGEVGCPATPAPTWSVDPPVALNVAPHFPNYAEFYPQGNRSESADFRVEVRFRLEDGQVLRTAKTLHVPARRSRRDELVREILEREDGRGQP